MTPTERHFRDLLNTILVRLSHMPELHTRADIEREARRLADMIRVGLDRQVKE